MTEQEFISLSQKIRGKLIALARRFNRAAGRVGEAEDVVQDALLTLWQLVRQDYPIRDAEALAVKLTKSCCVERYRKQHLRLEPLADRPFAGSDSASSGTERMDIETIRCFVQRDLSESQRKLLELRNENGLSLDQMAAVTGRPKSSIKVALSTARKKMMEKMKKLK